jgi:hypothetical protein
MMNKHISAIILSDKTKTFLVAKPLYGSFRQVVSPPFQEIHAAFAKQKKPARANHNSCRPEKTTIQLAPKSSYSSRKQYHVITVLSRPPEDNICLLRFLNEGGGENSAERMSSHLPDIED